MLYDPKWEAETKADPFKLVALVAWLEKQNPEERYCYLDNGKCLLARYFSDHGFSNVHMFTDGFAHGAPLPTSWGYDEAKANGRIVHFPHYFNYPIANSSRRETFGGALERARAMR